MSQRVGGRTVAEAVGQARQIHALLDAVGEAVEIGLAAGGKILKFEMNDRCAAGTGTGVHADERSRNEALTVPDKPGPTFDVMELEGGRGGGGTQAAPKRRREAVGRDWPSGP